MNATEKFIIKIAAVAMVVLGIMSCCADRHFKGIDTGLVIDTSGNTLAFGDKTGTIAIDPNENTYWFTISAPEPEPLLDIPLKYTILIEDPNHLIVTIWEKWGWDKDETVVVSIQKRVEITIPYTITIREPEHLEVWDAKDNKTPAEPKYVRDARADLIARVDRIMGMIEADMAKEIPNRIPDDMTATEFINKYCKPTEQTLRIAEPWTPPTTDWIGSPMTYEKKHGFWNKGDMEYTVNKEIGLRSDGIVVWREKENE